MSNNDSPGPRMLKLWNRLNGLPLGKQVFTWIAGRMVPYTASVKSQVMELQPGHAKVLMRDRRSVRNHLHSVHAVALVNLGEFTSGLAFVTAIPPGLRGIVVQLHATYLKKARGDLIAHSTFATPVIESDAELTTSAVIRDEQRDIVAEITATWRVRAAKPS